ncbi:DUF4430 domain-containing protein [Mangrovibacterium diazotrophicum]|uniref:Uncharacterized protein DUF4430 n=1 Tax=Mangrovibacterium diazotrophicum TaxID=1261403 RepID=A0A419WA03_9BACT|nr:DUF4430 domain-containing protein [Mangrovibacterium diazotrophicum]RKD92311.1 uncharacterized protein DUF4430 [Mangrovibacterium diazotrophicum]
MRLTAFLSTVVLMLTISLAAVAGKSRFVTVEINYGEQKKTETVQVECQEKMTALEALQYAADVKTHPVSQYVFVTGINGVNGVRGEMAWYYTVNGEKPKLAISQIVKPGDTISWRYVEDVCSCTVDKK